MTSRRQSPRAAAGVTLIELLIAVGIVAILSAIAYPSYQRYVARTHRDAAAACLSQYAQFMERYYTTNMRYTGTGSVPSLPCRQENDLNRRYLVQLRSGATESTYTVEAIPTDLQRDLDALQCGTLSIDQTGTRRAGTAGAACWR